MNEMKVWDYPTVMDPFHVIGITIFRKLKFDKSTHDKMTWDQFKELNEACKICGLVHFGQEFIKKIGYILKGFSINFQKIIVYYPRTFEIGVLILKIGDSWTCKPTFFDKVDSDKEVALVLAPHDIIYEETIHYCTDDHRSAH